MSIKYRLKEVAADFGMTTKDVSAVMEKFFEKPKSNTQVLTDEELNVVFDYITQQNQISSLEVVFAAQPAPKAEPKIDTVPDPIVLEDIVSEEETKNDTAKKSNFFGRLFGRR